MSRLDDILDGGLFTDYEGKPDYRTGKVKKQIKELVLMLLTLADSSQDGEWSSWEVEAYASILKNKIGEL